MKSIERINIIAKRLKSGNFVDVNSLAVEFDVSIRTIQRDLNEKIPEIYKLKLSKKEHLYYININQNLTKKDKFIKNVLLEDAKNHGNKFFEHSKEFFEKVKFTFMENSVYRRVCNETLDNINDNIYELLEAIENKNLVTLNYKTKNRKILPLKIANFDGFWYLVVFCLNRADIVTYYLKDIENLVVTNEVFRDFDISIQNKLEGALSAYFTYSNESYPVILHISSRVTKYFIRKPLSKNQRLIKKYENGDIEIEVLITHEMEIIPIVQKYLPYVKIAEPVWIWDIIRENIQSSLS